MADEDTLEEVKEKLRMAKVEARTKFGLRVPPGVEQPPSKPALGKFGRRYERGQRDDTDGEPE